MLAWLHNSAQRPSFFLARRWAFHHLLEAAFHSRRVGREVNLAKYWWFGKVGDRKLTGPCDIWSHTFSGKSKSQFQSLFWKWQKFKRLSSVTRFSRSEDPHLVCLFLFFRLLAVATDTGALALKPASAALPLRGGLPAQRQEVPSSRPCFQVRRLKRRYPPRRWPRGVEAGQDYPPNWTSQWGVHRHGKLASPQVGGCIQTLSSFRTGRTLKTRVVTWLFAPVGVSCIICHCLYMYIIQSFETTQDRRAHNMYTYNIYIYICESKISFEICTYNIYIYIAHNY